MEKVVFGALLGATIGFGAGYMGSRAGGACPIMCNPYVASIFGAVIGVLLAGGVGAKAPAYTPSEHLVKVKTGEEFQQSVLDAKGPVLVDFSSAGCRYCRKLEPVVHSVADRYAGRVTVVYVSVADVPELGRQYGISAYPTLILFNNGRQWADPVVGYQDEAALAAFLDRHVPAAEVPGPEGPAGAEGS